MKYTVIDITEEDYGCEGVPEDSEMMCDVLLKDENDDTKCVKYADRYLRDNDIDVGSVIEL